MVGKNVLYNVHFLYSVYVHDAMLISSQLSTVIIKQYNSWNFFTFTKLPFLVYIELAAPTPMAVHNKQKMTNKKSPPVMAQSKNCSYKIFIFKYY